jgi:hypothetical protein
LNHINHFSQRSANISAATGGVERVLFLGDSVTYGTTHVDQSEIFTFLVARDLPNIVKHPVEVLNASTGAWAVSNEVGYLQSRGTFGADVVIFVLNTGDLIQPFNPGSFGAQTGYPIEAPFCATSELFSRYLIPRLSHQFHDAGSTPEESEPRTDVKNILASLDIASAFCNKQHAKMAVVYSPCAGRRWLADPYPESLNKLSIWAHGAGVAMVNLGPLYAKSSPADVYFDGTHLRSRGNQLAAQGILAAWPQITSTAPAAP